MTKARSNAVAPAAKGDLQVGSGSLTSGVLGVGSDGQTLVADSSQTTGLGWAGNVAAGKNAVINGGFDIWQRGTSATFSGSAATYVGADRWWNYGGATCTVSRQTADTTTQTYGLRFGRNSGQTNTTTVYTGQVFESINSKPFAGQTVTISFYAKKGADAPSTLNLQLYTGTGTDQTATQLFSGWTGGAVVFDNAFTVSTTMTRYSYTGTIASTANQIAVSFKYTPSGTAGANEWFQIEGVQLELGSSATPFSRAGGTIQGELAACQRYYWRQGGDTAYQTLATGSIVEGTVVLAGVVNPVPMRVAPTSVDYSTIMVYDGANIIAVNSAALNLPSKYISRVNLTLASNPTANRPYWLFTNNSTSGYIGFSAEL